MTVHWLYTLMLTLCLKHRPTEPQYLVRPQGQSCDFRRSSITEGRSWLLVNNFIITAVWRPASSGGAFYVKAVIFKIIKPLYNSLITFVVPSPKTCALFRADSFKVSCNLFLVICSTNGDTICTIVYLYWVAHGSLTDFVLATLC